LLAEVIQARFADDHHVLEKHGVSKQVKTIMKSNYSPEVDVNVDFFQS
jgi:hypothetical protein